MSKSDGGPAFPEVFTDEKWSERHRNFYRDIYSAGGMSLRDYFAAHAPTPPANWQGAWDDRVGRIQSRVEWNYHYADIMLKERDK